MFVELLLKNSENRKNCEFDSNIGYFPLFRPVLQTLFVLVQMVFIFLNGRLKIHFSKTISRFGIMNLISTNICIWMDVLVSEIIYEISKNDTATATFTNSNYLWSEINICDPKNYFSGLFSKSRSILYLCTITYNLICAGILLEIWTNLKNSTYFKPILVKNNEPKKNIQGIPCGITQK